MDAGCVIAIDRVPERLEMARVHGKAETLNFDEDPMHERLIEMTGGHGPDRCIDAVGAEAHGTTLDAVGDSAKEALNLTMDRPHALRPAIMACRKAGTVSVPGVYIGLLDKIPFGALMNKGLTIRTGQTHVQRYLAPLLEMIESGKIDPSFVISHLIPLACSSDRNMSFVLPADIVSDEPDMRDHEAMRLFVIPYMDQ